MGRGDFPSAKQDQFMVRFPDGMRERIKEEAARNGRSMNAEIIHHLQQSLETSKLRLQPGIPVSRERMDAIVKAASELVRAIDGGVEEAGGDRPATKDAD